MKIGFTGAGGTGKTATLALVSAAYKDLPVLPSPARTIFAIWGINEDEQERMSIEDKIKLQNEIYQARFEQEITYPEFISDRTLLDNFAYHVFRCYQGIDDGELEIYKNRTLENLKTYDHVFYFPLPSFIETDGMRYSQLSYQYIIDSLIYSFLLQNNVPHSVMPVGTIHDRAEFVKNRIENK